MKEALEVNGKTFPLGNIRKQNGLKRAIVDLCLNAPAPDDDCMLSDFLQALQYILDRHNTQIIAGDSTPRLSLQEIEKEAEKYTGEFQSYVFKEGAKFALSLAQQQQGGLDGETLVRSSDYAELEIKYNKLKDAFEELLASSADRRITWSIDGTHLQKRNEFKNKWRIKAGIVLKEQKEK